jgi:hypothetical protein
MQRRDKRQRQALVDKRHQHLGWQEARGDATSSRTRDARGVQREAAARAATPVDTRHWLDQRQWCMQRRRWMGGISMMTKGGSTCGGTGEREALA